MKEVGRSKWVPFASERSLLGSVWLPTVVIPAAALILPGLPFWDFHVPSPVMISVLLGLEAGWLLASLARKTFDDLVPFLSGDGTVTIDVTAAHPAAWKTGGDLVAMHDRYCLSPIRYLFILPALGLGIVFAWSADVLKPSGHYPEKISTVLILLWGAYCASATSALVVGTARLTSYMGESINIRLGHPDGCGGLSRVAECSFAMSLPVLAGAAVPAFWAFDPQLKGRALLPAGPVRHALMEYSWACLLVVVVPLTLVAMLAPIWKLHRRMVVIYETYSNDYARRIEGLVHDWRNANSDEERQRVEKAVSALKALHPDQTVPLWPFDAGALTKALVPVIATALIGLGKLFFPDWLGH